MIIVIILTITAFDPGQHLIFLSVLEHSRVLFIYLFIFARVSSSMPLDFNVPMRWLAAGLHFVSNLCGKSVAKGISSHNKFVLRAQLSEIFLVSLI